MFNKIIDKSPLESKCIVDQNDVSKHKLGSLIYAVSLSAVYSSLSIPSLSLSLYKLVIDVLERNY